MHIATLCWLNTSISILLCAYQIHFCFVWESKVEDTWNLSHTHALIARLVVLTFFSQYVCSIFSAVYLIIVLCICLIRLKSEELLVMMYSDLGMQVWSGSFGGLRLFVLCFLLMLLVYSYWRKHHYFICTYWVIECLDGT
jgi:hypothetical protein